MYQSHDNLSLNIRKSESTAYFSISEAHHLMTVSRSHYLALRNKIISNFLQRVKLQLQLHWFLFCASVQESRLSLFGHHLPRPLNVRASPGQKDISSTSFVLLVHSTS